MKKEKLLYKMCQFYPDNRYQYIWIGHCIMVLTLFMGCFSKKYAICKKFLAFLLIIYHSFWLVGDLLCSIPLFHSTIALFVGMYMALLILAQVFDCFLIHCKCWGKEEENTVLEEYLDKMEAP